MGRIKYDLRDVNTFAAQEVPDEDAKLVVAEPRDPAGAMSEPGDANCDVRLGTGNVLPKRLDGSKRSGLGGNQHDHHFAHRHNVHDALRKNKTPRPWGRGV